MNCLRLFKERLALDTIPGATQKPVGHLVLSLRFSNFLATDLKGPGFTVASHISDFMSAVTIVLSHVTRLQRFEDRMNRDWYHKQSHIWSLSHIATCRYVCILISWKEAGALASLNLLTSLIKLDVTIPRWYVEDQSVKSIQPLLLPSVKTLVWTVFGSEALPSITQFLSRCRFGTQCSITLQMGELTPQLAVALAPLFTEHQVQDLNLVHMKVQVQAILAPSLRGVTRLHITASPPALGIAHLVRTLRHLSVTCCSNEPDSNEGQQFWAFLKRLETIGPIPPSTCTLKIMRENCQFFSWMGGEDDREYAAFIGKLLPMTARLSKQNIRILDCHDAEYTSLAALV